MDLLSLALIVLGVLAAFFVGVWSLSLLLKDASIVDIFWGLAGTLAAWTALIVSGAESFRSLLLAGIVTIWGLRLALHIGVRNIGHPEDRRYQEFRRKSPIPFWIFSLFQVFLLQCVIMWLLSMPVTAAVSADTNYELYWLDFLGIAIFAIGFLFEAIGDWQLLHFQRNPANEGTVLDSGLWQYTRHPNYFGESLVWWGTFIVALAAGAPWWTILSPIMITFFLLKVSGVSMLERTIDERRPEYAEYKRRTSAFFPLPPKKAEA